MSRTFYQLTSLILLVYGLASHAKETHLACVSTSGLAYSVHVTEKGMTLRIGELGTKYTIPLKQNIDIQMTKTSMEGFYFPMAEGQGANLKFLNRSDGRDLKDLKSPAEVIAAVSDGPHTDFGGPIEMLLGFGKISDDPKELGGGLGVCFVQWNKVIDDKSKS